MNIEETFENVRNLLEKHGQSHLLAFWDQLDGPQKQGLLTQIRQLDFEKIDDWVKNFIKRYVPAVISDNLVPASFYGLLPTDPERQLKYTKAAELGSKIISQGKVAAFVVAGGQGTRLGFDGPKGNFPISPVKNKTLFQIFAESVAATSEKYHTVCPWYIMTSPLNHADTIEVFRSNDYYGLGEENVFIFQQGTLPNFGSDGSILLADKATISSSPDGHGGSLKALYEAGAVEDMERRGVEFVSYYQVDNPLINIFDPLFIGLHALDNAEMSSKALIKADPYEKIGTFCLIDGGINVIEYIDLPEEVAEKQNPDGSLAFGLGSIAIHIINRTFIKRLNSDGFSLPLHRAIKKIAHIDENGKLIEPDEPNGIKLESFVFDALPLASRSIILQTMRSEEFAPVKNAVGVDSAEVTRRMMIERAVHWLESAGVDIPKRPDGSIDCVLEIAPGFALEKKDVKAKLKQIPRIKPGDKVYLA